MTIENVSLLLIISSAINLLLVVALTVTTNKLDKRNQEVEELTRKKAEPKREGKQTRNAHGQFMKRGPNR